MVYFCRAVGLLWNTDCLWLCICILVSAEPSDRRASVSIIDWMRLSFRASRMFAVRLTMECFRNIQRTSWELINTRHFWIFIRNVTKQKIRAVAFVTAFPLGTVPENHFRTVTIGPVYEALMWPSIARRKPCLRGHKSHAWSFTWTLSNMPKCD